MPGRSTTAGFLSELSNPGTSNFTIPPTQVDSQQKEEKKVNHPKNKQTPPPYTGVRSVRSIRVPRVPGADPPPASAVCDGHQAGGETRRP